MKRFLKRFFIGLLILFALIQFYPRPAKNINNQPAPMELNRVHAVPANVMAILENSCYDCHSNNTKYPWYSNLQPVAYFLGDHIREGKEELNFSVFGSYSIRRRYRKLEEMIDEVKAGEMPLKSYTLIHRNATVNKHQALLLTDWATALRDSIKASYPPDSLARKKN
jgi:hypothetical protein